MNWLPGWALLLSLVCVPGRELQAEHEIDAFGGDL
jgi:hypothetical protein